jgi:hypothetical protein
MYNKLTVDPKLETIFLPQDQAAGTRRLMRVVV